MTIEAILEETMQQHVDLSTQADWHDVGERVDLRARHRGQVQRISVAALLGVLGLLVVRTGYSRNVTASLPLQPDDFPIIDRWPTSAEVIEASSTAPSATEMWFFGLIVLGLPALLAWVMWFCAPDAMCQPTRSSRIGRWAIATTSGLLASLAVSVSIFVLLVIFYNPVAALARASLLTDTFAMSTFGVAVWVLAFALLVMVPTDGRPIRWARSGWSWGVFFVLFSLAAGIGSFAVSELRWDTVRDVPPSRTPIRGLLAPLSSNDLRFEFEGANVSAQYLLVMLATTGVLAGLLAWQSWVVLRAALGAEVRRWDRLSLVGARSHLAGKSLAVVSIVAGLVALVGFFGSTFVLHDQLADELPIPATDVVRRVEVHRWSVLSADHDSPLVTAQYSIPGTGEGIAVETLERTLRDIGYRRDRLIAPYEWSRPRSDQYDADFLLIVDDVDGPLVVEVTVFDTDWTMLSIPVTAVGLALLAVGAFALRRVGSRRFDDVDSVPTP